MTRFTPSLLFCLLLSTTARAEPESAPSVRFPSIPAQARTTAGFVPKGWMIESQSRGDLNGDGAVDQLLVLRMTNPRNNITNSGLGTPQLDTNPRILVVAFAGRAANGYSLALADHTLIPRHTNPVMDDPLESAAIVKGAVQVSLVSWMSAGSWYTTQKKLTFRYQDGCFKLIGYDSTETRRNSGEVSAVSVNYQTKRMKITKGTIENEREHVFWKTVRASTPRCLSAVGDGLAFDPEK
ncbi:MAG: hypothetical protein QOK37_1392 [Thermoanaerobaculia bacterium]|jgi:hypothetical protein|nr:hypothetical protein [Thermoanaerobaculia bacterium]